jgi:hypothetical protein
MYFSAEAKDGLCIITTIKIKKLTSKLFFISHSPLLAIYYILL